MVSEISALNIIRAYFIAQGRPKTTNEIREHLCEHSHYGANTNEVRAILYRHPEMFKAVSKEPLYYNYNPGSRMGCEGKFKTRSAGHMVDVWWLKDLGELGKVDLHGTAKE